tara:strand:+ start:19 stop:576 length:558 start_codon:yes stop_codon:yes gene_type:complete
MSIVDNTRKSLYAILAERVTTGNQGFQVLTSSGCRDSRGRASRVASGFQTWANQQSQELLSVKGNIIEVDNSILNGFPAGRPDRCAPLDDIRIMLDKDGYETGDPAKNVVRSEDGNVTHDWTRSYWFKGKKRDYYIYKQKIDNYVKTLQDPIILDVPKSSIVASSSLIPLAIIAFLLLYSRGGKK